MPPLPAWFDGREAVTRFFAERMFEQPWRIVVTSANCQPALGCYMRDDAGRFPLSGIVVVSMRPVAGGGAEVTALDSFLDPALHPLFELAPEVTPPG